MSRYPNIVASLILTFGLFGVSEASTGLTTKQVLTNAEEPTNKTLIMAAVNGYGQGFTIANSEIKRDGGKPLFCQPNKLALTPELSVDVVRRYVEKSPRLADAPFGLVLLYALKETFPCKD